MLHHVLLRTAASTIAALIVFAPSAVAATSYPNGWVDDPASGARLNGNTTTIKGWALDAGSTSGTGVDRVDVYVDGNSVASTTTSDPRPDIAATYGTQFLNVGYHAGLDLTRLGGGSHTLEVRAHSTVSGASTSATRQFEVVKPIGFGVNAHLMWNSLSAAVNDLNRVQSAGLSSVRFDLYWSAIEPDAKGRYDQAYLTKLDGVLAAATARGITPSLSVLGTPAWARNNTGTIMTPPTNPADYGDVMAMLAQREASVRGLSFEIWNEPNQWQFWNAPSGPNAAAYTSLLLAAYPRIKTAVPGARVLGGSIAFNDEAFLNGMYAAGARGHFDVLAVHPYSLANPPSSTSSAYASYTLALQDLRSIMLNQHDASTPIWITESGWSTSDVSDTTRAQYMQQAVAMLPRSFPYIEQYQAFALNQAEDMPDYGLTQGDGTPTQTWIAYVSAAHAAVAARAAP